MQQIKITGGKLNKALKILLATNALVLVAGAMLGPIYAIFVEKIGGDLLDSSIAVSVFAFSAGVTTLIAGKLSDKIRENELVVVAGYFVMAVGFLMYLFADSVYDLFVIEAIIGVGEAIYSPAFDAIYSKHIDEQYSGTEWGVWEAMNYFTAALGAVLGGLIASYVSFGVLFVIMAALCLASGAYILILDRKAL